MKKALQILSCVLFFCAFFVNASAEGLITREQVDTIVARSIRPFLIFDVHRWHLNSKEDNLIQEYLMFRKASDALYDELKSLSSAEAEDMIHFTGTNVFHKLSSFSFWLTYRDYVSKAESDKRFNYTIRDSQYAELARNFPDDYGHLMERAGYFAKGPIIPHGKRVIYYLPDPCKIDKDKLPVLMVKTLQEYFTYEEFKESKAECSGFLESLSYKFYDAKLDKTQVKGLVDSFLNDASSFDKLAEYMSISRGTLYAERGKYRPEVSGLKLKEGVYSGQTFDGLPDGRGELIDKRGVLYSGHFRHGVRHGQFIIWKKPELLDQDTTFVKYDANQLWFKGKFLKDVDFESLHGQILPEVSVVDGERFGHGCLYDQYRGELKRGFFIDGNLVGQGSSYSLPGGSKETGVYKDGLVTRCEITWYDKGLDVNDFHGIKNGTLKAGTCTERTFKTGETRRYKGEFIDDKLEGQAEYLYVKGKDTTTRTGSFAYGKMYGYGKIVTRRKADKEGKVENRSYEGSVYRNAPYGKGSAKIRFTSVPDDKLTVSRYGVKLNEYLSDTSETTINIEGSFVNGNLIKGKVTTSNGTYMQGMFADGVLAEGRLIKRYADGSSYDGECINGRYHGYGKITYADGSTYEGLFENGKLYAGKPVMEQSEIKNKISKTYSFSDLGVEKGVVRVVRAAGVKIMVRGLSSVEVGCHGFFNGDVMNEGEVWVSDGTWMEGSFEDGVLIKGKAKTIDKYGTVYIGEIKNGFPHGKGECLYRDGTVFKGNFANGNRMDGVHYAADGKVIKVYEN